MLLVSCGRQQDLPIPAVDFESVLQNESFTTLGASDGSFSLWFETLLGKEPGNIRVLYV